MNKNIIITAITSVLLTVFCFHAYTVYQVKQATIQNTQTIQAIVNFISSNTTPQK